MSKNEWKKLVGVAGRMLLAFAFVFSQTAGAGQDQKTKDKADSPQKAAAQQLGETQSSAVTTAKAQSNQVQGEESESQVAEEKSSGDGRHEGIKVHGHWTIEVRNPDGKVATHREFENSLAPSGPFLLGSILGRQHSVGGWYLEISSNTVQPCAISSGSAICVIAEPQLPFTGSDAFNTLSVGTDGAGSLILSGTAVAAQNGAIDTVYSFLYVCAPTVSPAACASNPVSSLQFTQAPVSPAVNLSSGQTVAVTVKFSFS